jgi:RND family efflux transporter MFP subunit
LPNRQVDQAFKSAGIVAQIRTARGGRALTMGDPVRAGDVLARVRAIEYQQRVDQAQAQLRDYVARRENARAALELAEKTFARASNLYRERSLTKQDYDRAQQQRDSAAAQAEQAEAGIASARTQLAEAQLAVSDTEIKAPFSGVIVARRIETGALAASSVPAFTIADIVLVKADFTIPDAALPQVSLGRKLTIRLTETGREIPARVTAMSASADPQSRVFTVELTAANPKGDLKPGMIGSVDLQPESQAPPHIEVPLTALAQSKTYQGFALFVVDRPAGAARVHERPVSIGATVGGNVQVLSGIDEGDRIVVVGAQNLHDNDAVRVLE